MLGLSRGAHSLDVRFLGRVADLGVGALRAILLSDGPRRTDKR